MDEWTKYRTSRFEGVKALNGVSGQIKKVSGLVHRRSSRQAISYLRELQRLEQAFRQLKEKNAEEAENDQLTRTPEAAASGPFVLEVADSVRARLEKLVRRRELLASTEFLSELSLS